MKNQTFISQLNNRITSVQNFTETLKIYYKQFSKTPNRISKNIDSRFCNDLTDIIKYYPKTQIKEYLENWEY